jgi:flagellar basal body P-ring protein FlgI
MKRQYRLRLALGILFTGLSIGLAGCSWWNNLTMRSQSPEDTTPEAPKTPLIGDYASATGMQQTRIEAIGLVVGLHGTGSDPIPGEERNKLLDEMRKRDVADPEGILRSGNASLVMVQGFLRPGVQGGDHFDVEVRVPTSGETTSLRGGYLLETRLTETAFLGNQLRTGDVLAVAKGPVMVDPSANSKKDHITGCRGRILGGGTLQKLKSRPLALVLSPDHKGVHNSSRIATAVNRRFHTFREGTKECMAKALTDEYIELKLHPRYKDNVARYVQVVRALAISETAPERSKRIATIQARLMNPDTSAESAMQLEAIGTEGVEPLLKGLKSGDAEVRFYAAEALAYLDRREAAEPLGQIAREQPAFRVFALTALSALQDFAAADQLRALLSAPSAETRYGAFRSLWAMNPNDPQVKGEILGNHFHYHVLDVPGQPMIHVTRSRLAEVVMFGAGQQFATPLAINAGNEIMITSQGGDQIIVARYSVSQGDQRRTCSTRVDDVIRAVVDLGGAYPDVVQALQEAKNADALPSKFEVDALPEAGRDYERVAADDGDAGKDGHAEGRHLAKTTATPASPAPDLFYQKGAKASSSEGDKGKKSAADSADDDDSSDKPKPKKGFFARMLGWQKE